MARGGTSGDWLLITELFERGEPSFVDELRKSDDADALGAFAPRWLADPRSEARRLLFEYLDRPLNAFRHEPLVKRLFKRAENAGDDALMARFLVCFDRAIRRTRSRRHHYGFRNVGSLEEANALAEAWRAEGYENVSVGKGWRGGHWVSGRRTEPTIITPPNTTMPRGTLVDAFDPTSWDLKTRRYATFRIPDWVYKLGLIPWHMRGVEQVPEEHRKKLERFRLFSIATRHYLRRRAWRYFRRLGRLHPDRYVPAVTQALLQYRDDDVANGLALIDNWGLIHILFHFSPVLAASDRQWRVANGRSLSELEPAPYYAKLWDAAPRATVDLLIQAPSRPVRSWAIWRIRRNLAAFRPVFPLEERLDLLERDDPEVVSLVADLIRDDPGLAEIPLERWLSLVERASPTALDVLVEPMERFIPPERVPWAQAVHLAGLRPLPLARLGLRWLQARTPRDEEECRLILRLVGAECEPLRPLIVRWVRRALVASGRFEPDWVLEWLDSRHADVRAEGWEWFRAEPRVRDDVTIWQRLMESPYDDVRLALVGELEARTRGQNATRIEQGDLDPELLRLLWASVLLNVHRGSRAKPLVVRQLLRRAEVRPDDLPRLLPLLAVALRSVRGPEWRAGLAAVVQLAERDEAAVGPIRQAFPELQWA